MSRGVKIRVWSEEGKKYRTDCYLKDCFTSVTGHPAVLYNEGDGFIVEQSTGMLDRNGTEIFEGDIVKVVRSYGYGFLPKGAKAVVEFDEKELCYKLRGRGEFRLTARKMVEVIGNIHEGELE